MPFDLRALLDEHAGQCAALYGTHVNPRFARAMGLIGFDRCYVRGRGQYLWDADGRRHLDMLAGYGVFNIGRHHPVVRKALEDFMDMELPSLVQLDTPLLVALAARELKARVGLGLDCVYFGSTGAEANETAIKFARRTTGRTRILHAESAFHGLTTGALALNGSEVFREGFGPLLPGARVPFGDAEALRPSWRPGMSRPSSSSRCRARASMSRRKAICGRRRGCATNTGRCSWSTRCRPGSAARADSSRSITRRAWNPTWC